MADDKHTAIIAKRRVVWQTGVQKYVAVRLAEILVNVCRQCIATENIITAVVYLFQFNSNIGINTQHFCNRIVLKRIGNHGLATIIA